MGYLYLVFIISFMDSVLTRSVTKRRPGSNWWENDTALLKNRTEVYQKENFGLKNNIKTLQEAYRKNESTNDISISDWKDRRVDDSMTGIDTNRYITKEKENNKHTINKEKRSINMTDMVPNQINHSKNCPLVISEKSRDAFRKRVLHDKANSLMLSLKFSKNIRISGSLDVILPKKWRWVFRDSMQYLQMPYAAIVWSLGLLGLHNGQPIDVQLDFSETDGICATNVITIGENVSDMLIGNALANMTDEIVNDDDRYSTSHWCYMKTLPNLDQETFAKFDDNFFSPYPSLEYICCMYNQQNSQDRIKCGRINTYNPVWWDVPLGLGILMLLFFPLIFLKASGHVHKKIQESCLIEKERSETGENTNTPPGSFSSLPRSNFLYCKENGPITATSTIAGAFSCILPAKQSTKSRLAIFIFSVLTLIIPALEFLLYFYFLNDYIADLAKNNISIGFSGLVAGIEADKMKFSAFGGPYVAIGIYLIIGWIIMLTPKTMADQIYNGVAEGDENPQTIFNLSLKKKEELGSVRIRKHRNGYFRLLRLQICHFYMLTNSAFWLLTAAIVKTRWCVFVEFIKRTTSIKIFVYTIACLCLPFYAVICMFEILISLMVFLIPLVSFIFCVIRGFRIGLRRYIEEKCCIQCSNIRMLLRLPCGLIVVILIFYYLYVFTVLFFDSFFFLSRVLMFTYTAVVAYPKETYGYFMLILISAYFALEGFYHFGDIYTLIFNLALKYCKKDETVLEYVHCHKDANEEDAYGISKELFEYLVEMILPRRVHALHTIIKFASIIFILSVSVILLDRFKKFEDLSLFIHVFITLFLCCLPVIYSLVISKENRKRRVKRKVQKYLKQWIKMKSN